MARVPGHLLFPESRVTFRWPLVFAINTVRHYLRAARWLAGSVILQSSHQANHLLTTKAARNDTCT